MKSLLFILLVSIASLTQAQENPPSQEAWRGSLSDDTPYCFTSRRIGISADGTAAALFCLDFNAKENLYTFMPGDPGKHRWLLRVGMNLSTAYFWETNVRDLEPISVAEIRKRFPDLFRRPPKSSKNKNPPKLEVALNTVKTATSHALDCVREVGDGTSGGKLIKLVDGCEGAIVYAGCGSAASMMNSKFISGAKHLSTLLDGAGQRDSMQLTKELLASSRSSRNWWPEHYFNGNACAQTSETFVYTACPINSVPVITGYTSVPIFRCAILGPSRSSYRNF